MANTATHLVDVAVRDTGFTYRKCNMEVDGILGDLQDFETMAPEFALRRPICEPGQAVALVLPHNSSAWLNNAIISIYMVGNPVRVKFASRDSDIETFEKCKFLFEFKEGENFNHRHTLSIPTIFGDTIRFDYSDGRTFLQKAAADEATPAICLFGSNDHAGRYRDDIKALGKKFVFEGPGKGPFIVLPDADLEAAARELAFSK